MAKRSDGDARDVLDAIRRIVRAIRLSSRDTERRVGVSAAQLFVLSRLHSGRAMSLNELAQLTLTHQSSASVVVRKLVERGLVQRTTSKTDRRRQELSLTAAGRDVLGKAPKAAQDRFVSALQSMRASDVRELARLLDRFVQGVGLDVQEPAPLMDDAMVARDSKAK